MDNQQERFLEWFGGIVDGEGAITLNHRWQNNRFLQISPRIVVVNTSKELIDECARGLDSMGIPYWYSTSRVSAKKLKPLYHLEIAGIKRLAKAIPYIRVRAKKKELEQVRLFIQSRLAKWDENHKCLPYTTEELDIVEKLYELHARKNPQRLHARILEMRNHQRNKI